MPINTELVEALLTPVAGENPGGQDLRYDPRYAVVKEARREDLDLPQGDFTGERKVADWNAVVSIITELSKETKDLQLLAWMCEALLQRNGFGGFATGLESVRGLVTQYWDTFYPLPEDDDLELRAGPLEWLGSAKMALPVRLASVAGNGLTLATYTSAREIPLESDNDSADKRSRRAEALASGKLSPEDAEAAIEATGKPFYKALVADLDVALTTLAALDKAAEEKFGRDAPAFTSVRNAMDEVQRLARSTLARKLELDPDPIEEIPEEGAVSNVDPNAAIAAEPTNRNDANARVAIVARWYRQQDPTSPAPYLMLRGFRWGELRATAPVVDPKLLEAPPTASRSRLKTLMLDGRWQDLLEQGEVLLATAQGRGWLDLQRYTLTACANLGASYDGVAAAIRSELRALLTALPALPEMMLMDDTPTANSETQQWLNAEELTAPEASEAPAAEVATNEDDVSDDSTLVLDAALEQDDATAQQGGLARPRVRRRAIGKAGAAPEIFDMARAELSQGRANRAVELLMNELSRERSPRGRFVRQTQMAWIMVEAGLDSVARPILERLLEMINERTLEEWEAGPLVAQPMVLLYRVLERLGEDEGTRNELYLRVCRLDPLQAMALAGR
jgi:type VI secretion system protein ImpA